MARPKKQADDKWRAWFNVNQDSYVGDENGVAICVCVNKTAERKVIAALNKMEDDAAKQKTIGLEIADGLRELVDDVKKGTPLNKKYNVRVVRKPAKQKAKAKR